MIKDNGSWMVVAVLKKDLPLIIEVISDNLEKNGVYSGRDLDGVTFINVKSSIHKLRKLGAILTGMAETYPLQLLIIDKDGQF